MPGNTSLGENTTQKGVFIPSNFSLLSLQALPTFRGLDSNLSIEEFLERLEDYAAQWQWSTSEKYFALKERLYGEARACIGEFEDEIKDFDSLKQRLLKLYGKKVQASAALYDFMAFKQPIDMPVERYFAQAVQKSKFLDFGPCQPEAKELQRQNMLLSMLKLNIQPQILRGILARNPQNLDELKKFAILEENAWLAVRANNNPFLQPQPEVFRIEPNSQGNLAEVCATLTTQIANLSAKVEKLQVESTKKKERKLGPCYACGREGHIARFCRNRPQWRRDANRPRPENRNGQAAGQSEN